MDRISLHSFSGEYRLAKSSVYRKCKELDISTSDGLTVEDCDRLLAEFNLLPQPSPEQEAIAPEVMPANFIQAGELAPIQTREIQLPQSFDPAAMVRFFDGVTGEATDTGSLVAIADLAISAVQSAMDQKIDQQRQNLTQAEKDAKKLSEKIEVAKTDLKIKALESRILAERQTSVTKSAEELFAELMSLGKPVDSGSQSS